MMKYNDTPSIKKQSSMNTHCDKFKCDKDTFDDCENKERFDCIGDSGYQRCGCECCEYYSVYYDEDEEGYCPKCTKNEKAYIKGVR